VSVFSVPRLLAELPCRFPTDKSRLPSAGMPDQPRPYRIVAASPAQQGKRINGTPC